MTAHIHAALMAEYAKDALETETPWEGWEAGRDGYPWRNLSQHPDWNPVNLYRRKPVALCQVEGRDVFPGDKLWWKARNEWVIVGGKFANSDSHLRVGSHDSAWPDELTWTEPAKTKTVYQWAFSTTTGWVIGSYLYESAENFRKKAGLTEIVEVRRLDYTALEVPA